MALQVPGDRGCVGDRGDAVDLVEERLERGDAGRGDRGLVHAGLEVVARETAGRVGGAGRLRGGHEQAVEQRLVALVDLV